MKREAVFQEIRDPSNSKTWTIRLFEREWYETIFPMKLSRRKFLRTQGALLTLPFMPSLASAKSLKERKKPDKKMVMFYVPNGINRRGFFPGEEQAQLPGFVGGFNADKTKQQKRVENKA